MHSRISGDGWAVLPVTPSSDFLFEVEVKNTRGTVGLTIGDWNNGIVLMLQNSLVVAHFSNGSYIGDYQDSYRLESGAYYICSVQYTNNVYTLKITLRDTVLLSYDLNFSPNSNDLKLWVNGSGTSHVKNIKVITL